MKGGLRSAAELREAFDRSFAEAPRTGREIQDTYLSLRCGGDRYALAVRDIAGLHANRSIQPLPGRVPALCGIATLRGALLPVYDLDALLGYGAGREIETVRWLIVLPGAHLGLAAFHLETHLQLPREALVDQPDASRPFIRAALRTATGMHAVLDAAALAGGVEALVRHSLFKEP